MCYISKIDTSDITLKGEFVLILSGKIIKNNESLEDYKVEIKSLLEEGKRTKDISKIIKDKSSFSKNEIYDYIISLQRN